MSQTIIVSILAAFFAILSMRMVHCTALNHEYRLLYKRILINNIRGFKDILPEAGYNL